LDYVADELIQTDSGGTWTGKGDALIDICWVKMLFVVDGRQDAQRDRQKL
jgi:hypothetical protein